jgi:hypothetical protein
MEGESMDKNRDIIEEKDEKIAQLEKQLIELKEAQQQIAATIAVERNLKSLSLPEGISKFFLKAGRLKNIVILVLLVIISIVIWQFAGNTSKQESGISVERVREIAKLATAETDLKVLKRIEDNKIFGKDIPKNLPGTKRELLMVIPASVIVGVDLKRITHEDMVINEETKEIDIILPHAEFIQEPSIQMDKIQFVDNNGFLRSDTKIKEFLKLAYAQDLIIQEAESTGLLDTAEKNAEKALKVLFKKNGYKVNVTFK